jgi:hypothetical protein
VQVVVQDDVSVDFQAFVLAAELKGVDEEVEVGFAGEEGKPLDYRAGD